MDVSSLGSSVDSLGIDVFATKVIVWVFESAASSV